MRKLVNKLKSLHGKGDKHFLELLRGSLDFFGLRLVGMAAGWLFMLAVNRWYGAAVFGIYTLTVTPFRISLLLGRCGLDNALVRFVSQFAAEKRWDKAKQVYLLGIRFALPVGVVVSAVLYFIAPVLAEKAFKEPVLAVTLPIIAIAVIPGILLSLNASVLRGLKRIWQYSLLLNVCQLSFALFFVVAGKLSGGWFSDPNLLPVTGFAAGTVAGMLLSFYFGSRPWREHKEKASREMRTGELTRVAFPMLLANSYTLFLFWSGTLLLGFFRPAEDVGIYETVLRVGALINFALNAINSIAASKFSESHATGDREAFEKVTAYAKRMIFWTAFPVGFVLLFFHSFILGLFGKTVAGGATALYIIVAGYFVNAISGPVGTILNMTGHQVIYQNVLLAAGIVNVGLCLVLIPEYGINGAAAATAVSMMLWNLLSVYFVKKKFGILTIYIPFVGRWLTKRRKLESDT